MQITAYKTPIIKPGDNLFRILNQALPPLKNRDIVAVSSKIVAISENRVIKISPKVDKWQLIKKESEYYIDDPEMRKYKIMLTFKKNALIASAGVDESNGNGYYILWPKNPDDSCVSIWNYLKKRNHLEHLGVLLTDSKTSPLRWGVTGLGISWCGFKPLKSYVNQPDLFNRPFKFEKTSILDSLATATTLVMGEGNEQTPLSVIKGAHMVEFSVNPPTVKDRQEIRIGFEDDIYSPLTKSGLWKKGGQAK